ncbi:MAG: fibronectin type III domain-containing protein, partial [Candidatus Krumholzibacteriota bacterium]|nr:fibronectin type III domain-containing protein [Candidatus Krumholzibacteriota bacterium]
IELEGLSEEIRLRDDGRGGDATAADGSYEIDFSLPASLRGIDLGVAGSFTDRAGNAAPMLEADNTISFTDPPPAVQFTGVIDSTTSGITLQWEESTEVHFLAYRIYRSDQTGVKETAEHFIRGLDNRTQTGYPDSGLKEGKTYYYKIFVVNDLEETAGSDEFAASTFDAYPDPVTMFEITSIGADRLTLTWSTSQVSDFAEYRVYRATAPGVTISSQLVVSITDREETFFDDTGIDTVGNTYYYRVMVYDLSGKYRRSNEVSTE